MDTLLKDTSRQLQLPKGLVADLAGVLYDALFCHVLMYTLPKLSDIITGPTLVSHKNAMILSHVAHQFCNSASTEGVDVEVLTVIGEGLTGSGRQLTFDCLPGSVGVTNDHIAADQEFHPGVEQPHEVVGAGDAMNTGIVVERKL